MCISWGFFFKSTQQNVPFLQTLYHSKSLFLPLRTLHRILLILIAIIFFLYLYPFLFLHSLSLLSWFRLVSFINNHWKVCLFIQQKFMEHLPRLLVIVMNSEWDGYHSVVLEPGNFSPSLPQNSSTCSSILIWSTNIIVLSPYWKWFNVLLPRTGVPNPWMTK